MHMTAITAQQAMREKDEQIEVDARRLMAAWVKDVDKLTAAADEVLGDFDNLGRAFAEAMATADPERCGKRTGALIGSIWLRIESALFRNAWREAEANYHRRHLQ